MQSITKADQRAAGKAARGVCEAADARLDGGYTEKGRVFGPAGV